MSDPISALQDQLQEACDALGDMPREIEQLRAENERLRAENEELRKRCKVNRDQVARGTERIRDFVHEVDAFTR